jgi:ribosome-binding factor A
LSIANIFVRLLSGDSEDARRSLLKRLRRATPMLRRALAPRLSLRKAPDLRFSYDTGHDAAQRVEDLLGEIAREKSDPGD